MQEKNFSKVGFNYNVFLDEVKDATYASKLISSKYNDPDLILYFSSDLTSQEETDLTAAIAAHDPSVYSPYLIFDLVNEDFKGLPLENVDFARHLITSKALNKKTTMLANGRPSKADYYDGATKVAEIVFEFTTTSENIMTERKEWLYYYKVNGTKSDAILKKHKIFDSSDIYDGALALEERVDSRRQILSSVKAFISGVMMAGGLTLPQVITAVKPFWDEYKQEREDFIELGTSAWKDALSALVLDATSGQTGYTPHTWLATVVEAPSTTLRDYIVARLTY